MKMMEYLMTACMYHLLWYFDLQNYRPFQLEAVHEKGGNVVSVQLEDSMIGHIHILMWFFICLTYHSHTFTNATLNKNAQFLNLLYGVICYDISLWKNYTSLWPVWVSSVNGRNHVHFSCTQSLNRYIFK